MGPGRSHRALVETANAIEQRSKKLVMAREQFGRDGKKMPDVVEHMDQLSGGRSRRLSGYLTRYGSAWGLLGIYIKELIEVVLDEDQDEEELYAFLMERRGELFRYTGTLVR